MSKVRINMGCGMKPMPGFLNVDVFDFKGIDKKIDLNKFPYDFKSNYADEIFCSHVIEHLDDPEKCLSEMFRILKKGGKLTIKVPYFAHSLAYSSWQHKHYLQYLHFQIWIKSPSLTGGRLHSRV